MRVKSYNRVLAWSMGLFLFGIIFIATAIDTYCNGNQIWVVILWVVGLPFYMCWINLALKVKDTRNTLTKLTDLRF